jgi:hypothetical protein
MHPPTHSGTVMHISISYHIISYISCHTYHIISYTHTLHHLCTDACCSISIAWATSPTAVLIGSMVVALVVALVLALVVALVVALVLMTSKGDARRQPTVTI